MARLIPFELQKIWHRRSFVLSICTLLLIHVFLLVYTSLPDEGTPPLAAYKSLQNELFGMSEDEKKDYMTGMKERLDGVSFVRDILAMQSFGNKMGSTLAEEELRDHPGVFEAYYDLYESGEYLEFTESYEQEKALIEEVYEEWQKVAGYGDYLRAVRESRDNLGGMSIFQGQAQDSYSSRNLQKSAADYAALNDGNICFAPSKSITLAIEGSWQDFLVFLSVLLFVSGLIMEEKEKKLFFITRSTRYGMSRSIGAKLAALFIHCTAVTVLFYSVSLVFFGQSAGWFEPWAGLQSIAPYMESSLPVSILGYLLLVVVTKAMVLFGIGSLLTALCILSDVVFVPFLTGGVIAAISMLLYVWIPAGSGFSVFKYLNPAGLMKTENLYGYYLNFNVLGYPVSRLALSLVCIFLFSIVGVLGSLLLFCRTRSLKIRKVRLPFALPFRPHVNLLRHEGYKILITNHALFLVAALAALLAVKSLDRTYIPSVGEQYYRDLMGRLEGALDEEKEALVLSEQARYDEAFQRIAQVDAMVNAGDISEDAADALRLQANMTLSFYPAFGRVKAQYQHIKEYGGSFVYDTGYLYFLGVWEDVFPVDLLILSVGIILAVSGALPLEYQTGVYGLLGTTKAGKRRVMGRKMVICAGVAGLLALVPVMCRAIRIASVYPMSSFCVNIQNIMRYSDHAIPVPIWLFLLFFALSQMAAAIVVAVSTLVISMWRKSQMQTIFFALLILAVPLILKLLGFAFAKWISLYPLYAWTGA